MQKNVGRKSKSQDVVEKRQKGRWYKTKHVRQRKHLNNNHVQRELREKLVTNVAWRVYSNKNEKPRNKEAKTEMGSSEQPGDPEM